MIILKIDWNTYYKIPEEMLPLLNKMQSVKEEGSKWVADSRKLEVQFVDGEIATGDNALIARINRLEADLKSAEDSRSNLYKKTKELEAKLTPA